MSNDATNEELLISQTNPKPEGEPKPMENNESKPEEEEANPQLQSEIINKLLENKEFVNVLITMMKGRDKSDQKSDKVDLSKLSIEELQALIEKKKQEEANKAPETIESLNAQLAAETDPQKKIEIVEKMKKLIEKSAKITIPEPKQGDLVKFVYSDELLPLKKTLNAFAMVKTICEFPGPLKSYCTFYDIDDNVVSSNSQKINSVRIFDVDIEKKLVIDEYCSDSQPLNELLKHL